LLRFTPSLQRDFDLNDLRYALLNYIVSSKLKEKFQIQIDDIKLDEDQENRLQKLLEILKLFDIKYENINFQSNNLKYYQQLASKLLIDKRAFCCFCSQEELDKRYSGTCKNLSDSEVLEKEEPFCIRIDEAESDIEFFDELEGQIILSKDELDSFIILSHDKNPSYSFACAIDDLLSDTSILIQSKSQIKNTAKQILIHKYLGYEKELKYAHLDDLVIPDNLSIESLLDEGYLPSSITNYLILTCSDSKKEIFTQEEALEFLTLENLSSKKEKFDLNKLKKINKEHIRELDPLKLSSLLGYLSADIGELAKIYAKELDTIREIKLKIDTIFSQKEPDDFKTEYQILKNIAKEAPYFEKFDDFKAHLANKSGFDEKTLFKPLQFLLTKSNESPILSDIYPHIKNYLGEIIK